MTGGAVSKRARRRARNIFLNYINDAGLPLLNELLLNYSGAALKRVLELLADRSRYPIGLYCTAGKDRTGLVILLVLAAIKVDVNAITEDYVLSDTAYDDLNDEKALVGALEQVSYMFMTRIHVRMAHGLGGWHTLPDGQGGWLGVNAETAGVSCAVCHFPIQNNLDPEKFLRAPGTVIEHTMRYIEARYGSVEAYLDSIGFTAEKREELRMALTGN